MTTSIFAAFIRALALGAAVTYLHAVLNLADLLAKLTPHV